jgi:hypothetical protein
MFTTMTKYGTISKNNVFHSSPVHAALKMEAASTGKL